MARFNYNILNPQSISELSDRELRQAYSELRSIARKRADRLEARGYEARRFAPVQKVMQADLEQQLAELAYYLRSPSSLISIMKKEKEQASLGAHGYSVFDFKEFGRFMDDIRYRFENRKLRDSDTFVQLYEAAERREIPIDVLQAEFGKFLDEEDEAKKLLEAMQETEEIPGITADEISQILNIEA